MAARSPDAKRRDAGGAALAADCRRLGAAPITHLA
jgi:hypothetical protein